jgi:hypothetical protein
VLQGAGFIVSSNNTSGTASKRVASIQLHRPLPRHSSNQGDGEGHGHGVDGEDELMNEALAHLSATTPEQYLYDTQAILM